MARTHFFEIRIEQANEATLRHFFNGMITQDREFQVYKKMDVTEHGGTIRIHHAGILRELARSLWVSWHKCRGSRDSSPSLLGVAANHEEQIRI
jgi:hypothetical protein